MKQFVIFAVLMACGVAQAQQVDCAKFSAAIEEDMKALSIGAAAAGPHEARDAALAAAAATKIQVNLLIMQAAKCKLPTEPVSASYYFMNAASCAMKEKFGTRDEVAAACAPGNWERKK